ncbi:6794_t:CDS:10 [Scutellospora calospora]|uniref:6794_t:CDS:1 n=1 Tax=Scutellospora calospora TaxID=85575 RepID=A0ACA9JU09_9GLOM|nr:6794_t:CDS:10 [Scutellospora calospora]
MKEEKDSEIIQNELYKEDLNSPTKKELIGWYLHSFAVGVYDTAAISVFIPVVLEKLASHAGYELDQVTPCNMTVTNYHCVAYFGSSFVDTDSYSLYIISLSVLLQAILFISCGSLADHGNSRKKFLLSFSFVGAISTIAFVTIVNPPLKSSDTPTTKVRELEDKINTKLSSYSVVAGLSAGLIIIFGGIGMVLLVNDDNSPLGYQLALALCGVWWLLFLIFPTMWLTGRPRPPLPKGVNYFLYSWKRVGKTLKSTRELWQTMKFLFAWFFIADGQSTIVTVCVLFGKKNLGMTDEELLIFAIEVPICAVIGIYLLLFIQQKFQLTTKTMIILECIGMILLPLYAILGFWLPFGLVYKWEVWIYLALFGLLVGSLQSYCQACFAGILPEGHENEFFSLFQITAKGSSGIGPLVSGAITNYTHNIRFCYWFLFALIALPTFIIATIDVEKGKNEAKEFVRKENEMENTDNNDNHSIGEK